MGYASGESIEWDDSPLEMTNNNTNIDSPLVGVFELCTIVVASQAKHSETAQLEISTPFPMECVRLHPVCLGIDDN